MHNRILLFIVSLLAVVGCTSQSSDRSASPSTPASPTIAASDAVSGVDTPSSGGASHRTPAAAAKADTPTKFVSQQQQLSNPLDATRAFMYLQAICSLGPRPSGSPGMTKQQQILAAHFKQLGGKVSRQEFEARHPVTRERVKMTNLIVEWHPERTERVLLCAHYDTRPLPDRDPNPQTRRTGEFIGANDGGSGVAVLMELARLMPTIDSKYGVDFVLFDGEELVYVDNRDKYFLGSEHFAGEYAKNPPPHKYKWGVLLDLVGDSDLQIYYEAYSYRWRDTRPLLIDIWTTAARLGVDAFVPRVRHEVRDDHLALRNIAKIPTCNIIDFDYPYWHTASDVPQKCSGESLAKVGWVVYEWLRTVD
jgi:hypothetical protein